MTKTRGHLEELALREVVEEEELLRLSVAAFAMFNRGRQWVTEDELSTDLAALVGERADSTGARAPLSPGHAVLGRFFFVHQAQAVRDGRELTACEFLHATFGEYLLARLVARELTELAHTIERSSRRSRRTAIDDGFLYALLSFGPLSLRRPRSGQAALRNVRGRFHRVRSAGPVARGRRRPCPRASAAARQPERGRTDGVRHRTGPRCFGDRRRAPPGSTPTWPALPTAACCAPPGRGTNSAPLRWRDARLVSQGRDGHKSPSLRVTGGVGQILRHTGRVRSRTVTWSRCSVYRCAHSAGRSCGRQMLKDGCYEGRLTRVQERCWRHSPVA